MRSPFTTIVSVIAAIAFAGCASSKPSGSSSLSGSSWVGLTGSEEELNFEFRRDGKFVDHPGTGTWQQQGDAVTIAANYGHGDVNYVGTVQGSAITGTARGPSGKTFSWRVNRSE